MNMHVAIPTINVERSIKFYQSLGFSVASDYVKAEQELRIIRLEREEQVIELMSHRMSDQIRFSEMPELQHIGLSVNDLDAILHELQLQGVTILRPITNGVMVKRFAFVADPSGFPVELFEKN